MAKKEKVEFEITALDKTKAGIMSAQSSIAKMGRAMGKVKVPLVAGAAAVGGFVALATQAIKTADAIAKTADKIGITTDELQELRVAADLSGVSANTLDMAMQRLSRRLGEAAMGKGELVGTLKQYNISAYDAEGRTRRVTDVMGDLANTIKNAESDQEALRIAVKAFDSEGAALVNMLRGGKDGFEAMRQQARDLGLVIDEKLLRSAEEANDKITLLAKSIGTNFTSALLHAAPMIGDLAKRLTDALPTLIQWVDQFGQWIGLLEASPEQKLAEITSEIEMLESAIDKLSRARGFFAGPNSSDVKALKAQLAGLIEQKQMLEADMVYGAWDAPPAPALPALSAPSSHLAEEAYKTQLAEAKDAVATLMDEIEAAVEAESAWAEAAYARQQAQAEATATGAEYLKSLADENELLKLTAAGKTDQVALMRAEAEMRARVGRELLPAEKQQLEELIIAQQKYTDAVQKSNDKWDDLKSMTTGALSSLEDGFEGLAKYALRNLDQIYDMIVKIVDTASTSGGGVGGGGFLGALFAGVGSLFGFGGAAGAMGSGANAMMGAGAVGANGMLVGGIHSGGIVGKDFTFTRSVSPTAFSAAPRYHRGGIAGMKPGEVPAILQKGEGVFTPAQMRSLGLGGGSGGGHTFNVTIGEGASVEAVRELESYVRRIDGSIEKRAIAGVNDAAARNKMAGLRAAR